MRILKHIFSFDDVYFDFLCSEMLTLGKNIREKFKDNIVKNSYVFGVVDFILKNMFSDLLPFKIYCHAFFCRRGWTTQLVNVMNPPDFLLMTMILAQKSTRSSHLLLMILKILRFHIY